MTVIAAPNSVASHPTRLPVGVPNTLEPMSITRYYVDAPKILSTLQDAYVKGYAL